MANDLPTIVSPLPNDVRNFLQRVREMLEQSGSSRLVTVADLLDSNIGALSTSGELYTASTESYDFTPPPAPTNLEAVGALTTIMLQWDNPAYANLAHTEIWRASVDNQGAAVLIGTSAGVMYSDSVNASSTYYYWVRFISKANLPGAFNAISGTLGQTSQSPTALLNILASQITASQLASSLGTRINLIDTPTTGLVATVGDLSADILLRATKTELDDAVAAILAGFTPAYTWAFNGTTESWTANAATLTASSYDMEVAETGAGAYITSPAISVVGATYALIYIKLDKKAGTGWTGKVQYQTAGHGYSDSHYKVFAQPTWDATYKVLALDMNTLTAGGTDWATSTITGIRIFIGAGNGDTTDIDTIEIGKSTIDQMLSADINARLATAEVDIDANAAAIALKASQAEVTGHGARLTTAEADIDANAAAISLRATSVTVSAIDARVGVAEADIDANAAAIALKAASTTVDALDSRVTTAEANINANTGTISLAVLDAATANTDATAAAAAAMNNMLAGANAIPIMQGTLLRVASAEQTLTAHADQFSAEAAARLSLTAIVEQNIAAILSEQTTRANGDSANASSISTLSAQVNHVTTGLPATLAAVQTEQTARVIGDSANASSISAVQARLDTGDYAAVKTESSASADAIIGLHAQYTVKVDAGGYVTGFGLASTLVNGVPYSEFAIRADNFSIAPVNTDNTAADGSPFFYRTAATEINGVSIPAGAYMKSAYIHDASITNAKIGSLAVDNAKIADAAVTSAKIGDAQITSAKIVDAAITSAKIGDAQITSAKIVNAAVDTLKIADQAVTFPYQNTAANIDVYQSLVVVVSAPSRQWTSSVIVMYHANMGFYDAPWGTSGEYVEAILETSGGVVLTTSYFMPSATGPNIGSISGTWSGNMAGINIGLRLRMVWHKSSAGRMTVVSPTLTYIEAKK